MSISVGGSASSGYDSTGIGESNVTKTSADTVHDNTKPGETVGEAAANLIHDNTKPGETVGEALGRTALQGNYMAAKLNAQLDAAIKNS